ncbi:MAG: hypothetical protein OXU36_12995 [Candidatus Poribacteria bacterium]|nr:hypothetical protein [Candidatus Poribacteria bacterium]
MNKILFATFVVVLSLGITFYIHQNVDAGTPKVDASASCGDNSASASVSPSISEPLQEDEEFFGNASCYASAGFNVSDPDDIEIWVKTVRRRILFFSWLSTKSKGHSANAILLIDRNGNMPVDTSADASGTLEGADPDSDTCPTSS